MNGLTIAFVFTIVLCALTTANCYGTTIVVIRTDTAIWIGADGKRTDYHDGSSAQVCKLHEVHGWLLAKAGISVDAAQSGGIYSVDQEIKRLTEEEQSLDKLKRGIYSTFYDEVLANIRYLLGGSFPKPLEGNIGNYWYDGEPDSELTKFLHEHNRTAALFGYDKDHLTQIAAQVRPGVAPQHPPDKYQILVQNTAGWQPLEYVSKSISIISGAGDIESNLPKDEWARKHPLSALEQILVKSTEQRPDMTGPPYTIVRLRFARREGKLDGFDGSTRKLQIDWIKPGACPGWNTDIH